MHIDVAINPFGADVASMVRFAEVAEGSGAAGVWVADHFSGSIVGRPWSRDPFVCLGAIAARTERVRLGVLVANMMNRHAVQLASAVDSLDSLAPGRVVCGVGSGAAPASRFASEHQMIGTPLGSRAERRQGLDDLVAALRSIWSGNSDHPSSGVAPTRFDHASGIVDDGPAPPIVIGASGWSTVELASRIADGVNIRETEALDDILTRLRGVRPDGFEVSVLGWLDEITADRARAWARLGVDRIVLGCSAPHDPRRLESVVALVDEIT